MRWAKIKDICNKGNDKITEWNDVNCGNTNEMSMWPSQWIAIQAIAKIARKKIFGASTGFEPMASALALQCSPSWAMKTHILEAAQPIESINPWKEWNTEWNDVNCGNTNKMSMWPSQWIAIQAIAKIAQKIRSLSGILWMVIRGL